MKDELMPAKEVAAYWVEHVLRHGGAQHLQSKAKEMPFYQLYFLDVWLFLFSVFTILLITMSNMVNYCTRKRFCKLKIQ